MLKFRSTIKIKVPEDFLYKFSVDEWRTMLARLYDVDPESVTSFESVAEHIIHLWLSGRHYDFADSGITSDVHTLECIG